MPGAEKFSLDAKKPGGEYTLTQTGTTATTLSYASLGDVSHLNGGATESAVDRVLTRAIRITRVRVITVGNTRTNDISLGFRDDGATVASVTVTAGAANTEFDSGALSVEVVAGSKCNFIRDLSAGTGTLSYILIVEYEFV